MIYKYCAYGLSLLIRIYHEGDFLWITILLLTLAHKNIIQRKPFHKSLESLCGEKRLSGYGNVAPLPPNMSFFQL